MTTIEPDDEEYPVYLMGERPDPEWYLGFKPILDTLYEELLEDNDVGK